MKTYKPWYAATAKPQLIDVEAAQFLSIAGKGDPSGAAFGDHIQALYTTAYTLKFQSKEQGNDFVVAKLEGLWSFDEEQFGTPGMADAPRVIPRSEWNYRLLIRMPEFVTTDDLIIARQAALAKKQLPLIGNVTWHELHEGRVVQMMHNGPFDKEPETLQVMLDFMTQHRLAKNGLHHEIYLSDFRRTAPDKLKTILREPVKDA